MHVKYRDLGLSRDCYRYKMHFKVLQLCQMQMDRMCKVENILFKKKGANQEMGVRMVRSKKGDAYS